jgi:hypothetical protein
MSLSDSTVVAEPESFGVDESLDVEDSVEGSATDEEVSVTGSLSNMAEDRLLSLKMLVGLRIIEDNL